MLVTQVLLRGTLLGGRAWWKSGATTNSMKLIWLTGRLVDPRSIMGETGRPRPRSRSPCRKNSSSTRRDHLRARARMCMQQPWPVQDSQWHTPVRSPRRELFIRNMQSLQPADVHSAE